MKRVAWIFALSFALGCPADDTDENDTGADSAQSDSQTASGSPTTGDASGAEDSADDAADSSGSADGGDDSSAELGCAANIEEDTTDGASDDVMQTWGAPCTDDAECIELLGEGGVCLTTAVIYELPQGYCSKLCELPPDTQYSDDDPQCDPNGGVDCIGQAPLFQVCSPKCTDDAQCSRNGYTCRNFPLIASEGDPTYCLMPDCCEESCDA
ncbi:MAG: hypothetical protein AAGA54_23040 [Myxococcota bacterium]